jgi:glyoxylase-like metal-dependent hydrolase (beta-lactamase superfamily II)
MTVPMRSPMSAPADSPLRARRADVRLPATMHVLERGWLSSNNIVFDDGDAVTVVDTGYALHAAQTAALIQRIAGGRPLTRIINTHLHSDHVGGNALLQQRYPAALTSIPPGLAAAVDAWDVEALTYAPTGQDCPPFRYQSLLRAGEVVRLGALDWQVQAAQGHDPHMVMLYNDDERILLSADALWENGFGAIFPEIEGESGFVEQRAALDSIAARRPRVVIPGHGAAFTDVEGALQRAHARLDALAADPARNARHVVKVLIKFWLLQVRAATREQALGHFGRARYFQVIQQRYFADTTVADLIGRGIDELVAARAAAFAQGRLINVD